MVARDGWACPNRHKRPKRICYCGYLQWEPADRLLTVLFWTLSTSVRRLRIKLDKRRNSYLFRIHRSSLVDCSFYLWSSSHLCETHWSGTLGQRFLQELRTQFCTCMPNAISENVKVLGLYYLEDLDELSSIDMGSLNRFIGSPGWFFWKRGKTFCGITMGQDIPNDNCK